jgi:hypothetical protein
MFSADNVSKFINMVDVEGETQPFLILRREPACIAADRSQKDAVLSAAILARRASKDASGTRRTRQ